MLMRAHEAEERTLSSDLSAARVEVARLAAEVQQLRHDLRGSVPAPAARREAEELRATLAEVRNSRAEALRQAEVTSHRLIAMEMEHVRWEA